MPSSGVQRFRPFGGAILGDSPDHLQRPVHGGDEVDVDDELELRERVDPGLARRLVDAHGQIVTGDARGRHAQRNAAELAADRIEDGRTEPLVGRVALERNRERAPGVGVELLGDVFDRLAHVDERHGGHPARRHRGGHCTADAASAASDDRNPFREIHKSSVRNAALQHLTVPGGRMPGAAASWRRDSALSLRWRKQERALRIAERYGLSIYDALIVSAALLANCKTLHSEVMQDGQVVERQLTIRNPFTSS